MLWRERTAFTTCGTTDVVVAEDAREERLASIPASECRFAAHLLLDVDRLRARNFLSSTGVYRAWVMRLVHLPSAIMEQLRRGRAGAESAARGRSYVGQEELVT